MELTPAPMIVSNLICHRDAELAVACLGSLRKFSHEPIQFFLHDDGSLLPEGKELIRQQFPDVRIIDKTEADDEMAGALRSYPNARKYREQCVHAKKLFDCVYFHPHDKFAFCDSDILFLRPFTGLFTLPTDTHLLLMQDCACFYAVNGRHIRTLPYLRLPRSGNCGLISLRRSHYDLDFIEWLLAQPELDPGLYFTEQTIWALLSSRIAGRLWNPRQVTLMSHHTAPDVQRVAAHFSGPSRYLMEKDNYFARAEANSAGREPVTISTIATQPCRPIDIFLSQTRLKVRDTVANKWLRHYTIA